MTVDIDTLDFEGDAAHHAHGALSLMASASSSTPDGRPDQLANLVERHRPWAIETAMGIISSHGAFDEKRFKLALATRADIAQIIGMFGMNAHEALNRLLIEEGRRLGSQIAEA